MDWHWVWYALAAALVIVGVIGSVLPALPGVPLVFVGLLLAAWADGFAHVGPWLLVLLGVLALIAIGVDFVAGVLGAKKVGASRYAVIGATLGTFAGLFLGIPGIVFGPFVGALLGELAAGGTLRKASGVGVGAWIGFLVGSVAKLGICGVMLGIFAFAFAVR
jgi:uncharacterized protein YqgC (DUF456 family)